MPKTSDFKIKKWKRLFIFGPSIKIVKYCHQCGHHLSLGVEIFCPNCGTNLQRIGNGNIIDIAGTQGDVIGTGFSSVGNIIGKEVGYTVQGNIINFQISCDISNQMLEKLQNMMAVPTQLEQSLDKSSKTKDLQAKIEESNKTHTHIKTVLDEVNKIEKERGTKIEEIKIGEKKISTSELSLKEIILKGNDYFYKKEYQKAIEWYNKALEIDKNNFDILFNMAYSLDELGRYNEAIEWHDKALRIKPDFALTLNNKGSALNNLGKYNESIECYDKARDTTK